MRATGNRAILSLLVVAGTVALTSCVDEGVVYEDRDLYQPISEQALDFLGYADPSDEDQLTVCGYCHGDYQAQWEGTAHAMAWEGLMTSDHAQDFCEACHTVNSLGNVVAEPTPGEAVGGHASVLDTDGRYHDVQCESCHGPGLPHASNPTDANAPLAPVEVGADLSFGCGECHQGVHHPFVEEWEESPHANVTRAPAQEIFCNSCHTGEGALLRLGVTADYLGKDELLADNRVNAQITCAVCHDPHSARNDGQLRFPVVVDDAEDHICAQCHDFGSRPGAADTIPPNPLNGMLVLRPHSPETDLLGGTAGYRPPTSTLGTIQGPHGVQNNERLCASCHVVPYEETDDESGTTFFSAGHGFRAAPCVGPDGLPTGETGCAINTTARSFRGCLGGGCHESEAAALQSLDDAVARINALVGQLSRRLAQVDPDGLGPDGPIDRDDAIFTVAEGAYFNLSLALHPSTVTPGATPDNPRASLAATVTHNPALIEALLEESLAALDVYYGADGSPRTSTIVAPSPDR